MQRPYKVSKISGQPVYDSLPVAKITDYPLEERDYKPFAQCIFCVGDQRLFLRMWAFEVSVMPTSALACVLYPFRDHPDRRLSIRIEHGEGDQVKVRAEISGHGVQETLDDLELHPHNGEDLQGVYWGMTVSVPMDQVQEAGGSLSVAPGDAFPGNFYKTCEDQRFAHQGSHFPARFPDDPFGPDSMGTFQVVPY